MNGDSRETGKLTPEGKPDPSVFSTEYNREGIRVGTTVALMVRKEDQRETPTVLFRNFWGVNKKTELLESVAKTDFDQNYEITQPTSSNRFSFRSSDVSSLYTEWVKVADLPAIPPFNGPIERRGFALISIDKEPLVERMTAYFDVTKSDEDIKQIHSSLMMTGNRIVGSDARKKILREFEYNEECIVRYPFKPFDFRWCYLENLRPLFSEPSPQLLGQRFSGNAFLMTRDTADKKVEGSPFYFSKLVCDYDSISGHSRHFPVLFKTHSKRGTKASTLFNIEEFQDTTVNANLSDTARAYLAELGITDSDTDTETAALIWMHTLAIGYSPAYLKENADGIRQDFPRIPLPNDRETLITSATIGRQIAALLDPETPVPGVTSGKLRPELKTIAVVSRVGTGNLDPNTSFALTAGWGHAGQNNVTMPGKGKVSDRPYTPEEQVAIAQFTDQLGTATRDIHLNDIAYWKNIPDRVWSYTIGGYQVIKKWLSYREQDLLGRSLKQEEVIEVTQMARRITAILLLEPGLDANYEAVKQSTYQWSKQGEAS